MAELVAKVQELTNLDPSVHWFCPCANDDQHGRYFDDDCIDLLATEDESEKAARQAKIRSSETLRTEVLTALRILAYDGTEAAPYTGAMKAGLKAQLARCEICVREFHRARGQMQTMLEADYTEEDVNNFLERYDAMNNARISAGLDHITECLTELPAEKRDINSTGEAGIFTLFEALNCGPFITNENELMRHFDKPFKMVQSKKKLKLPTYAPGVAAFLFSHNAERQAWAFRNFTNIKRPLTGTEFEYSVKPYLQAAAGRVSIISLELNFLSTFWRAVRLITSKLTKELIASHFCTMDTNIYKLSMEHWQVDAGHFADMAFCYQRWLEVAPEAFWTAMGGINGQHVAENILNSPVLQRLMQTKHETESLDLERKLGWVMPFIRSIKPGTLVPPTRLVFRMLLHKFQEDVYSGYARTVAWKVGLAALLETIKLVKTLQGGPVVVHLLEVIAKEHTSVILQELEGIEKKGEMSIDETEQLVLDIVEAALALDVQSLTHSRVVLEKTQAVDHEISVSGLDIWKMAMRLIKPGYPALATAAIAGTSGLLSLEKFSERQIKAAPKLTKAWNMALDHMLRHVHLEMLERLEASLPEQLVELYQEQKAAKGLVALLFNGEAEIHQATLSLFKGLSGEDNRRDTLMHLLKAFFDTTLTCVASAQGTIARSGIFAPCSTFLKITTDVLSCLCDSQDGYLRSATLDVGNNQSLERFWAATWSTLDMLFRQTEPWSQMGYDKIMMQDFCRATMDFADYAFDQYSILANTLLSTSGSGSAKEVGKKLLGHPTRTFGNATKWLRLRDEYLIAKAVSLTCKMLVRLQEVGIRIDEKASKYIEDVVTSTDKNAKIKTKLTANQKAELQRALEKHVGRELAESDTSGRNTPVFGVPPGKAARPGTIDVDAWQSKSEAEKARRQTEREHNDAYGDLLSGASKGAEAWKRHHQTQQTQQSRKPAAMPATQKAAQKHQEDTKSFLLKRKQDEAAAKKNRADALARQKLGAGSGVAGLGDMGKDHALKGQNVMVSSGEESEGDDEDDDLDDLFKPKNKERRKIERPEFETSGLRPEVKKGPTRIQRTTRSLKDMRARLAPDLQSLHRVILKWDYFHDGDYPPGAEEHMFQGVKNSYLDPTSYQSTFEPLLTLEAWQGMVKSREENSAKPYEIKVLSRSNVDNLIEISSMISSNDNQRELSLHDGDVVLLSRAKRPNEDASAPHCLARICKMKRSKAQIEVVYQFVPGSSLAPALAVQAVVWGMKVQSITPLEREFGALQGLQYYDLCQQIIRAAPSKRIAANEKQIANMQEVWKVNRAQGEAVHAALENEGFSLIQGPPGSGKTKTIVAIVGGLLSQTLSGSSSAVTKINVPRSAGAQAGGGSAEGGATRKLLVCAPSNAAVDELVMRLKDGVTTKHGKRCQIKVVRIGRSDAINSQALDVTMDELVAKRLDGNGDKEALRIKNGEIFKQHESISATIRALYDKQNSGEVKGTELTNLMSEIAAAKRRKNELGVRIDNVKDQEQNAGREAELSRKRAQQAVLDEAHVICATLSGSGHDMFQSLNIEFETVIIDEAAQCVEMSSLIPLKYGCVKCVMVGDPKQLPPTVFSKEAAKFQYEQSLFVRMQNNSPTEVHLLDTQYRMHPDISVFPSRTFYDGLLKDGDGMASLRQKPWHKSQLLAPYRFFDVQGQHSAAPKGHSLVNAAEVDIAMALYDRLMADFGDDLDTNGRAVGIITPYKSQLRLLKDRFSQRYGQGILDQVEFNTTDAFQGRESEIIIFSCVRASPGGGIGFLNDIRRMNVGLTRAKSSLWVLGNSASLSRGQYWRLLVEDAKARQLYTTGNVMGMLRQPSTAFPVPASNGYDSRANPRAITQAEHRPPGTISNATADSRKVVKPTVATPKPTEAADKMEGIRYRFEDRVSKKRPASPESGDDDDVEMKDAPDTTEDSAASGTKGDVPSLDGVRSRDETPASVSGTDEKASSIRANGTATKPRAVVAPSAVPQAVRKKPAASPFMPAKKKAKPTR
ncbi:DEAD-box type RNA helicase [Elasticomyces elasticus]|nr:DEAD-box type RNA helicase [Elasticomyces elasticus]KAK4965823.1 DEAD-box type RNA helicase [Elasticomyces elasticus]